MKKGIMAALLAAAAVCLPVKAAPMTAAGLKTIYNSPYVSFAPDGQAWTVNLGDRNIRWYQRGTTVNTGVASALREPEEGEHIYYRQRTGEAPVGRWVVEHEAGQCIHSEYPSAYHGISYRTKCCEERHYSGWRAYCADCGEVISDVFVYMSREAAETINCIPLGLDHFSLCPFCGNLEQGRAFTHVCRAVSANMYRVVYDANFPEDAKDTTGYMAYSLHMYGDAEEYEGMALTPVKELSPNAYGCTGYRFAGWNRMPDGTGEAYEDGARIQDLTSENWNGRPGREEAGTVLLYAQWETVESTLRIDPDGGTYGGESGITEITKQYGERYTPDASLVEPPGGYRVTFQTNGGTPIPSGAVPMRFREWAMTQPFSGFFKDGVYCFTAPEGNRDTLRAVYEAESIVLPAAERTGYSFGGWYYDAEFQLPAGGAGDSVTPSGDVTLYAQWVSLELKAVDNYRAYEGSGAVDLSWQMQDGQGKTYLLYQSPDGKEWTKLGGADDICDETRIHMGFKKTGKKESYTVPDTGIYRISLSGAQGGGYREHEGGRGGSAELRIWLEKDEVLTFEAGGSDGYNGGGYGSAYGGGGGCTVVSSDRKGVIAVAGGGGGASESGDGGPGGSSASLTETGYAGEDGKAGGGGGFRGGTAGKDILHVHKPACYRDVTGTIRPGAGFYSAYSTESGGVYARSTTSSGRNTWAYGHSNEEQAFLRLRVGNASAYLETPYAGTLTFTDTDVSELFDTRGPGAESTSTAVTVFYIHENGSVSSETVLPERLGHSISVDKDIWYREGSYQAERPVYIHTYAQRGFSGTIELRPRAGCEYPTGVFHGAEARYRMQGTFRFEVPEDVKGVYIEAARFVTSHESGCWMSVGVQDLSYRYNGRELRCGYGEGQAESTVSAHGGSSYIDPDAVLDYALIPGNREGDGCAVLEAVQLGFQEELKLEDVKATDLAAPCAVAPDSVKELPAGNGVVSVSWEKPADRGTTYYHKAEAYPKGETSPLCVSNITQNTLVSGVAGYYYKIDGEENSAADESWSYTAARSVEITLTEKTQYLHLAAADAAGNISGTIHVPIEAEKVPWKLTTTQLQIGEGENVHAAEAKTYYVRCDGVTPFLLKHGSCMEGPATKDNRLAYSIFEAPLYGQNIIYVPAGEKKELVYTAKGAPPMICYPYSGAEYAEEGRRLDTEQMFTLGMEAHGQRLEIIPRAGGVFLEKGLQKTYYSDPAADAQNGIVLIGDGEGPVIGGLDGLSDGQLPDNREETLRLQLTARDDLSGVAAFYLKVTNLDNHASRIYDSQDNVIELEITGKEALFTGEFAVTAYAVDNVGNETELSRLVTEFALETEIERILTPHDPVFKGGESGILHITVYGYADRVEVEFPAEFWEADERLKKVVFDYSGEPLYRQSAAVQFMVPLYIPTDREYTLKVRAFRGDKCLESDPALYITSEGGAILDEFRTRLR